MFSTIASISTLLLSFGILSLGHGLQNTLLNIRGAIEHYSDIEIGLMNSCYFMGFIIGTRFTNKSIRNVGQIRSFAALVSVISTLSLMHVMYINPVFWILLRFIYGICISGAYMVIESWLNALSNRQNRGRILSIYMIINFLGLFLSQLFVTENQVQGFTLFAVVSIFASLSLVPLILSKAKQPEEIFTEPFSLKKLYQISPLAVLGAFLNGVASSAFWAFGALFILKSGFTVYDAAIFIAATFVGALIMQWPLGYLSDLLNRKIVIGLSCFICLMICFFIINVAQSLGGEFGSKLLLLSLLFGGFSYPLYSLLISLANDFLKAGMFVKASSALLGITGIGSIFGPLFTAIFFFYFSQNGLFYFLILIYFVIFSASLVSLFFGRKIPQKTVDDFIPVPKTAASIYNLDPRYEKKNDKKK